MRQLASLALVFSLCLPAAAEVRRLGLFIGVDQGLEGEAKLRYAARDAAGMESLFRQTGLYRAGDIALVANADLDKVRKAMERIEAEAVKHKAAGGQAQVFVYFSGHGDAKSLHIRGRKLAREDLVAWLNRMPSELKIVILDACESGDFLRTKGGRFLQELPAVDDDNLKSHGVVIVSSTSRGEAAQESDAYKGAVFTHHLLNGLRGLADFSGDGWVGLQEAFEYSRRATAMDAALAGSLAQNPSFDLDLVGGSDPGLIPLDRQKAWIHLRNFKAGNLEIFDAHSLDKVSGVWLSGADSLGYRIQTGTYLFRYREGGRDWLYTGTVGRAGGVPIDRKEFKEKVAAAWTSKGGYAVRLQGIQTSFGLPHPFPGTSMTMGRMAWVDRTASGKTSLHFGIGRGRDSDSALGLATDIDVFQAAASRTWFLAGTRRLHFLAGGMAGYDWVRQNLHDSRFPASSLPLAAGSGPADQVSWFGMIQAGIPCELEWNVWRRIWLVAEVDYMGYAFRQRGSEKMRYRLEMEPYLQLGLHF